MAKEKRVTIVVAGSNGEAKDIALSPGVTVQETLEIANLQGYTLSRDGKPFATDADLYSLITDGEKVQASLETLDVGARGFAPLSGIILFFKNIRQRIKGLVQGYNKQIRKPQTQEVKKARIVRVRYVKYLKATEKIRVIRTYQRSVARVTKLTREKEYWQDNGWVKFGNEYKGHFKTQFGEWRGLIKEIYSGEFDVRIFKLPAFIKASSHGECFLCKGNGWYQVHFLEKPTDISSAILTVEKAIYMAHDEIKKGK